MFCFNSATVRSGKRTIDNNKKKNMANKETRYSYLPCQMATNRTNMLKSGSDLPWKMATKRTNMLKSNSYLPWKIATKRTNALNLLVTIPGRWPHSELKC